MNDKQKQQKVVHSSEEYGRKIVVVKNSIETDHYKNEYYCAYVSLGESEAAYRIACVEPLDIPVDAPGGFTYSSWGYPGIDLESRFYIGWDYGHAWDEGKEYDLDKPISDAMRVAEALNDVTLADAARRKLSRQPDWFVDGLEEVFRNE